MRNTIRTAFRAALAVAALCALITAPEALAEGESARVIKTRLGSLRRDDLVVVDVVGVPGGSGTGGTGGVDTNAVLDIVREELSDLSPESIGALPNTYVPPVTSVNAKTGDVVLGPEDVRALPDTYVPPVTSVNGKTGEVVVAVSDVAGAVTSNDVESIVGRHYETNTSVRIESVEGRVSATEQWQYTNGVTRSAVESGFTDWAVEFKDPPADSSPPYGAVVAQAMADGHPTGMWSLFSPTDTVHSTTTALLTLVPALDDATNLMWDASAWGPVTATRVRVPTVRELDAKAEAKDLQAATVSFSNYVSQVDEALTGTKADLTAVADAKADLDIVEYELTPPRMDTNDVWVVDLDDTVLHFSGEDAADGFQTWAGTNDSNSVWVSEDGGSNVLAGAVSYLLEVTVGSNPDVSRFQVLDVATGRKCGLPTSQFGTVVIVKPPEALPIEGFKDTDLRYEYDTSAVPVYSKVLLSYKDAGNGNALTNVASIGRGRRRRIETSVVYGTGLEKAVAGLRDDLVSRRAVETGFTEWAIESDRPLGEDIVPGLVEGGYVGTWSLFPAGSTDRGMSAALTTTVVGGGASVTNLTWRAAETKWGVAVRATRTRVPTMADLQTIENTASSRWDTVSTYIPWLEDYATNNYTAAKLANKRAKDLEAWQYTSAITRADIERGMTGWAVTPMWPLGRVEVRQITDGADAGKWALFRPGGSAPMPNVAPQESGDNPVTNLVWGGVSTAVNIRWTNELTKAGIAWNNPEVDAASGKTNVTATFDVVARRTVIRASAWDYAMVSNVAVSAALAQYYPEGNVKSTAEFTQDIKYDALDTTTRTIKVRPFCNTGDQERDNSGLAGRVVIPPFVDADGNPYIFDDGTRYRVVGVKGGGQDANNANLISIIVPSTVTTIEDDAFIYCDSLSSVSLPAATTIGSGAFHSCSSLSSVSFPAATTIGRHAFDSCDSLSSVSLPSATTIGDNAFSACYKLSSVSLPAATSVGSSAFANCTTLSSVDFGDTPRSTVPTLGTGVFQSVPPSCKIIVPDTQYDAWITASEWKYLYKDGKGYKFLKHSGPVAPKRYPLFIIDLNPGEARNWHHIELKASTNNFTRATTSNMVFFTSSTCNETNGASFDLPFEYDWCRLYVMSKRTNGGNGDIRAWTRIRRTGDFVNLTHNDGGLGSTYAPLTLLVIVDPDKRYFRRIPGFASWLREDNDEITWSYVRIGAEGAENDQDGKQCWRPIMPVRWYEKLPSWADAPPTIIDNTNITPYPVPEEDVSAASMGNALETSKPVVSGPIRENLRQ